MSTVVVANPLGADITPFMDVLLAGTALDASDTVVDLGYTNQIGAANISDGADLLHTKLSGITGKKRVLAYSEGAQVATVWLRRYGTAEPIPAADLDFTLIGNSERRYGGFIHGHSVFDSLGDTAGLPQQVPYTVRDFARQYDGWADFPTGNDDINQVLAGLDGAFSGPQWINDAIDAVVDLVTDADALLALGNAVAGAALVHTMYFDVALDDTTNVWFADPDRPTVSYGWAPTYPVPMLGVGWVLPFVDRTDRLAIEKCYDRPVSIALPQYAGVRQVGVTGWWAQIHAVANLVLRMVMGGAGQGSIQHVGGGLSLRASMTAVGAGVSHAQAGLVLTAGMGAVGVPRSSGAASLALHASMTATGAGHVTTGAVLSLTAGMTAAGVEHYARTAGLVLSALMEAVGVGASSAVTDLSLRAVMSAAGAGRSKASAGLVLSASMGVSEKPVVSGGLALSAAMTAAGAGRYVGAAELSLRAVMSATGAERYRRAASLALSTTLAAGGAGVSEVGAAMGLTASMTAVGGLSARPGYPSTTLFPSASLFPWTPPPPTITMHHYSIPGTHTLDLPATRGNTYAVAHGAGLAGVDANGDSNPSSNTQVSGNSGDDTPYFNLVDLPAPVSSLPAPEGESLPPFSYQGYDFDGSAGGTEAHPDGGRGAGGAGDTTTGTPQKGGGAGDWGSAVVSPTDTTLSIKLAGGGTPKVADGNAGDGGDAEVWIIVEDA